MKNVLLSIIRLISISNISNIIFIIIIYLLNILLIILHKKLKKDKLYKLLCFIPLILSIIHFLIFGLGSIDILKEYIFMYIPSILMALSSIFSNYKKTYIIMTIIINIITIICSIGSMVGINKIANYTLKGYDKSFISLCDYMKKNYVLKDYKKLDFDKLKEEYLPSMIEAEKTKNKDLYYETLEAFLSNIYDGHVSLSPYKDDSDYILPVIRGYHDYGFSLTKLDNGDVIAIDVDDDITNKYGLKNGDIVTYFDNLEINKALDKVKIPLNLPVKENEDMIKPFYLAATGDKEVVLTFIDDDIEKKVSIPYINENGLRHLKNYGSLNKTYLEDENFSAKMLDSNIGYLRVSREITEDLYDYISYLTLNHKYAKNIFRDRLTKLKNEGMTKLVIDIRNNGGGYDEVAVSLVSLLSKDTYFAYANGVVKNNKYEKTVSSYITPDNEFSNLEVVVLTSMRCASACDGMVSYLSKLPNVTVVGLSNPEGINQETGGVVYMPEGIMVKFPTGLVVDEDDNPNIDTKDDRISRNQIDIKIPYTKEAAMKIYSRTGDYELEWVLDYLND